MKKILILCDAFPPAFGPRMGYLCKYLKDSDWKPYVISEAVPGNRFTFLANDCPVIFVDFYKQTGKWSRKLEWLFTLIADLFFGYKDNHLVNAAKKWMKQEQFDLILCSTYRTFPLQAAARLAREYNLPLVADTRDIIEQYPGYEFMDHKLPSLWGMDKIIAAIFRHKLLKDRNKVLRAASYQTTVSSWHVDLLKQFNPNIELIYNGFDPEIFYPAPIPASQFIIVYTGRLISTAMRNPELLFKALKRLSSEGLFPPAYCRVSWYVDSDSKAIIQQEAVKYGVTDYMDYQGFIPATEVPQVLNRSSVLLLLTNKSGEEGANGLMTTKFFESLAVEKPILCIQSDEGCLEAAIREANAGLAGRNEEEVYQFLRSTYQQWKEQGYTSANVRKEVLSKYSRKEQANQFVRIFNTITIDKDTK